MCGISGFYSKSLSNFDHTIKKMSSAIMHRGPDNSGIWQDKSAGVVFGHQRLSILDLSSAGHQPMKSNSERFIITYNGEIYNHKEIRKEIEIKNRYIKWKSNSDTETLLESIETFGLELALNKISGMFAFALWDQQEGSLTLARDRIGEKPLYFGWQGTNENKVFLFSSELKALKAHPEFKAQVNRESVALQLRYNYIPAPYSIYKDIYKLLPGHYLQLKNNDLKKNLLPKSKVYWSLIQKAIEGNKHQFKHSQIEIQNNLEICLRDSIKKQMISDVPLGAFLSGGIDSSTVVALMQSQQTDPVKTFTIGYNEDDYSEAKYAKKIAKHLGTDHTELYISAQSAREIIPRLPTIYDEPFSDSSQIPTYLVSHLAKQNVKVALSGDGGDELFCGYNRYTMSKKFLDIFRFVPISMRKIFSSGINLISPIKWDRISKIIPGINQYPNFGDKIHKAAKILQAKNLFEMYYILCTNWENLSEVVINSNGSNFDFDKFDEELKNLNNQEQMMAIDFISYLPNDILTKVDRSAMSLSLETRMPLLDHELIEHVWKIPHSFKYREGNGKWIFRQILNKYVPKDLTERPKMGFGVPIDSWLRGPLREWAENLINENRLRREGYYNPALIIKKWKEHLSGKKNWQSDLWNVLMFQSWVDTNKH